MASEVTAAGKVRGVSTGGIHAFKGTWPVYTPDGRATMVFDGDCRVVTDSDRDARLLWQRIATSSKMPPRLSPGLRSDVFI